VCCEAEKHRKKKQARTEKFSELTPSTLTSNPHLTYQVSGGRLQRDKFKLIPICADRPVVGPPGTVPLDRAHGFTCVSGGRTTTTLIRTSRGPGPFTTHPTTNTAGVFSFQPSYSGVYEAAPPDSPSNPRTSRTSADRRRYPSSLVHVAQRPMPRGFHPRPNDLFSSYKPSHMFPCASRAWLRIRRGQSITNTPCWRGCDQARTASG
jgi:hypothetical protein